jgi:hypothetical protein
MSIPTIGQRGVHSGRLAWSTVDREKEKYFQPQYDPLIFIVKNCILVADLFDRSERRDH